MVRSRRAFETACGASILGIAAWLATPAFANCPAPLPSAGGITYSANFDSIPEMPDPKPGDFITTEYSGEQICFVDDMNLSRPMILDPLAPTQSDPHALQNHFSLGSGGDVIGSRDTPLRIYFLTPMRQVSVRVGWGTFSTPPEECTNPIVLTAWGRLPSGVNGVVASATLPSLGVDVVDLLSVVVADPLRENIIWVDVDFGCFFPEVIDDLEAITSGVAPVPDTTDPIVNIDTPT